MQRSNETTIMQQNMSLAKDAIDYARKLIKESSTSLSIITVEDYINTHKKILDMRSYAFDLEVSLKNLFRVPDMHFNAQVYLIKGTVAKVKKFSVGNCGEYSDLALNYLRKQNVEFAEGFIIGGDDHVFVVIGRDANSDPNDPEKWGANAVVCDPWSNNFYPANEITTKLLCYKREKNQNVTYSFDPTKHRLTSFISIGGNDSNTKDRALADANQKLEFLQETLNIYINESSKINEFSKKQEILALLENIESDIIKIEELKLDADFNQNSNMWLERKLSKIVLKRVKDTLGLAEIIDKRDVWTKKLIDKWLDGRNKVGKLPGLFLTAQYYDIIYGYDTYVALGIIREASHGDLERLALERRDTSFPSIMHHLLYSKQTDKFNALCMRLSSSILDKVDESNIFSISTNTSPIERVSCKMIHFAVMSYQPTCFNSLVEIHSQNALDSMVDLSINGLKFPQIVLNHLGINCFLELLERLSPKKVEIAAKCIQLDHMNDLGSLIDQINLIRNIKARQACTKRLVLLVESRGNIDELRLLANKKVDLNASINEFIVVFESYLEKLKSESRYNKSARLEKKIVVVTNALIALKNTDESADKRMKNFEEIVNKSTSLIERRDSWVSGALKIAITLGAILVYRWWKNYEVTEGAKQLKFFKNKLDVLKNKIPNCTESSPQDRSTGGKPK